MNNFPIKSFSEGVKISIATFMNEIKLRVTEKKRVWICRLMKIISTFWDFRNITILIQGSKNKISHHLVLLRSRIYDRDLDRGNQTTSYGENRTETQHSSKNWENSYHHDFDARI